MVEEKIYPVLTPQNAVFLEEQRENEQVPN